MLGNSKARLWLNGRKGIFDRMASVLKSGEKRIWIHASSLGEFEQGRPVIEKLKEQKPDYKIVLTFFSPSGYEIRKNYPGADYIFYLPMDTRTNSRKFLDIIQPRTAIFVKYEFWYHYLNGLRDRHIPLYLISANFRSNQHFFSWYGGWFKKLLHNFEHIFVQNEASYKLLNHIGIKDVTIAGDTRFDRVYSIASAAKELPEVKKFAGDSFCLVAGSTWEPDEEYLIKYMNETRYPVKLIIAPHEIREQNIQEIIRKTDKKVIRYSQLNKDVDGSADVLIIDNIGMLSSLYRYGKVAYIGGGFGKGIHNILEAATFGLPVLFGPNYGKFQEAVNLIRAGGAFPVADYPALKTSLDSLITDKDKNNSCSRIARQFVEKNLGATGIILNTLK